jgi:hypothetical protein
MPLTKALATNATDSSFPSKIPTGTEPSGNGVISFGVGPVPNNLLLVPYGTGDDDATFDMLIYHWRRIGSDPNTLLWIPIPLAQLACTLCTKVGVANRLLVATERFCDTIEVTFGSEDVFIVPASPGGNLIGHVVLDWEGGDKLEICFDLGTATAANCLYGDLA